MAEECRSGPKCGLCFTRRTRVLRHRYPGCDTPDPWAPMTGGQWRTIFGPLTKEEREGAT